MTTRTTDTIHNTEATMDQTRTAAVLDLAQLREACERGIAASHTDPWRRTSPVLLPPEDLLLLVAEIERHRERVGPVVADLTLEILTLRDEVRAARGDRDRWFQAEARARADVEAEVAHALAEERSERDATAPMRVEAL